ncbi:MAG: hypothetical protein IT158_24440 [Bryobacterales bacterium]|nr:hypothetical protein [Bryobacterales bacterium]
MLLSRFRILILLAAAGMLLAQGPIDNEGVIKLVKAGMTEEMIISVIQSQPGNYVLGADDFVTLKAAGVSEKIIAAMLAKKQGTAAPAAAGAPSAGSAAPAAPNQRSTISGPGLYYRKGSEYFELLTENVEWKTSGAVKNIVSAGIVKKDLKGAITGPSSRNFLVHPMEVILVPPKGITISSYILLPMKTGKGIREFNVGRVNQKSGVAKGAIPFGVEKVGDNMFRMVLQTPLAPGEYGILQATPSDSTTGSKMHTFRVTL